MHEYTTQTLKRDLLRLSQSSRAYAFIYGSPWDVGTPVLELSADRISPARVVALRRAGHAEVTMGTVAFGEGCRELIFSTRGEIMGMVTSLTELVGYPCPGFRRVVVQPAADGPDLSTQAALLENLGESPVQFWFREQSDTAGSMLLLAADGSALKELVHGFGGADSRTLRGRLAISKKGFPLFQAKKGFSDFIPAIADWVEQNHGSWPALRSLSGARLMVRGADGEIVDRQRADKAWRFLG